MESELFKTQEMPAVPKPPETEVEKLRKELAKYKEQAKSAEMEAKGYIKRYDAAKEIVRVLKLHKLTAVIGIGAGFGAALAGKWEYYIGGGIALIASVWFIWQVYNTQKYLNYISDKYTIK